MVHFAFVSNRWLGKALAKLGLAPMYRHHVCLGRSEFSALEVGSGTHFVGEVGCSPLLASYSFIWVPPHLWLSRARNLVILKSETFSGKIFQRSFHRCASRVRP